MAKIGFSFDVELRSWDSRSDSQFFCEPTPSLALAWLLAVLPRVQRQTCGSSLESSLPGAAPGG